MPRTRRRSRADQELQELIAEVDRLDRESKARWIERNRAAFAPAGPWRRTTEGILARALQDGGCTMVVELPSGWCVVNDRGESFAPADGVNNPRFGSEDAAVLAVDTQPGYFQVR